MSDHRARGGRSPCAAPQFPPSEPLPQGRSRPAGSRVGAGAWQGGWEVSAGPAVRLRPGAGRAGGEVRGPRGPGWARGARGQSPGVSGCTPGRASPPPRPQVLPGLRTPGPSGAAAPLLWGALAGWGGQEEGAESQPQPGRSLVTPHAPCPVCKVPPSPQGARRDRQAVIPGWSACPCPTPPRGRSAEPGCLEACREQATLGAHLVTVWDTGVREHASGCVGCMLASGGVSGCAQACRAGATHPLGPCGVSSC